MVLIALAVGYALGSIPFGVIVTRLAGIGDVRNIGSGNIGATNVLRTGRKDLAAATLIGDTGKAMLAVVIVRSLYGEEAGAIAGAAAFLGHLFPVWLGFKGGKGVATILGGALAVSWPLGMGFALIWLLVVFVTRTVSVGSIIALAIMPLIAWLRMDGTSAIILALAASIAIWKHRGNISRLRHGFEPKLTFGKGNKS